MKTQLTILITFFSFINVIYAQNFSPGEHIYFTKTTSHYLSDPKLSELYPKDSTLANRVEQGTYVEYIGKIVKDSANIYHEVRPFNFNDTLKAKYYNGKIFEISETDINSSVSKYKKEIISLGAITIPFKIRPKSNTTSYVTDFNINGAISWNPFHSRVTELDYGIIAGVGISSVSIANRSNSESNETNTYNTATLMSGFTVTYRKIQLGLFFGVDKINNNREIKWEFHNKMWYGLGIGYTIFAPLTKKEN